MKENASNGDMVPTNAGSPFGPDLGYSVHVESLDGLDPADPNLYVGLVTDNLSHQHIHFEIATKAEEAFEAAKKHALSLCARVIPADPGEDVTLLRRALELLRHGARTVRAAKSSHREHPGLRRFANEVFDFLGGE